MKKTILALSSLLCMGLLASCGASSSSSCSCSTCEPSKTSETKTSEETETSQEITTNETSLVESSESLPSSEEESSMPEASPISLYRGKSTLALMTMRGKGSECLPTYHHRDFGDVPFVEMHEFIDAFTHASLLRSTRFEKLDDNFYALSSNNLIVATFHMVKQEIIVKNMDALMVVGNFINGGVGNDTCAPNDSPSNTVHTNYRSTYIGEIKDEVYDLEEYGMAMEEIEEKVYIPFSLITSLLFRSVGQEFVYNGQDYFLSTMLQDQMSALLPGAYASCYANENEFTLAGKSFRSYAPLNGEKYRFASVSEDEEGKTDARIYSFEEDGDVVFRTASSPTELGEESPDYPITMTYTVEEGEGIFVRNVQAAMQLDSTFKIPFGKTYFGTEVRTAETARFTLDLLRLEFDRFYGLKEDLHARYDVKDFDELIDAKNLRARLLSNDSLAYDEALCEFLMTYIDDGHTKYIGRSLYSGLPTSHDLVALSSEKSGERRTGLFDKLSAYKGLRKEKMMAIDPVYEDESKQIGLFLEDKTAVIRFDTFNHAGAEIANVITTPITSTDITATMATSSCNGFYLSFEEIKKHDEIENVVIDLTCNGGGMANTLPYLAAHFTDDPSFTLHDTCMDIIKEYHYSVDLNRNGIFGEKEDTYKDDYKFYVLTSDFSFSCANGLPTMAKQAGVKLIGKQSGGGACPVATINDGSGTIYNTSMNFQISYKNDSGEYVHNDAGNPVDYPLDESYWYDLPKLNDYLNNL